MKVVADEHLIRDPKDRPILRASIKENIDIFLTGDKDFLESKVKKPKIMSVADFMSIDENNFFNAKEHA